MGDQCVNICKVVPLSVYEPPADPRMMELIPDDQLGDQEVEGSEAGDNRGDRREEVDEDGQGAPDPLLAELVPVSGLLQAVEQDGRRY